MESRRQWVTATTMLQRRETERGETLVKNSPVDANTLQDKVCVDLSQVSDVAPPVADFKHAD